MSDHLLGAPGALDRKWRIDFETRCSLARTFSQPLIVDDPVGLVVFSDSSAVYLALVVDPGQSPYKKLPSVKAKTYIHGWTVNSGRLYVLDGVELSAWDLRDGTKREIVNLLKGTDVQKATDALNDLQKALQRVEWATLLEQAEDEWVRLTAQQSAAPPLSDERDRLDTLASDYFRMLRMLREVAGSTGGAAAARQLVAELRRQLAAKREAAKPWCFSAPVIRKHAFEKPMRALFVVQGNGTIYSSDKALTKVHSQKWTDHAELNLALLEPNPKLSLLGYIGNNKLRVVDANEFEERGNWAPENPPLPNTTHTLTGANKQFWWGTESGIYACQTDESGRLQPTWRSGQTWSLRQVGRLNAPTAPYEPRINPNDLFDTMNVHSWVAQRRTGPLNDGITAQLSLSDANGKYTTPPDGTSYIVYGPFERDGHSATSSWTHIKPHPTMPVVLLSDSHGASSLCRFPTPGGVSQLLPQWSVAPWLSSVTPYSQLDFALAQSWPTPAVRPRSKPFPDMMDHLRKSSQSKAFSSLESMMTMITQGSRQFGDRELRMFFWYALYERTLPTSIIFASQVNPNLKKAFDVFYNATQQISLRERFAGPGGSWDYMGNISTPTLNLYPHYFSLREPPVNFDPPWVWKSTPPNFHTTPPAWYDPWGYNRPGDFETQQPSPTYLDPFCFDGHIRFPQRRAPFDTAFKGRRWAVFTDNDPASVLAHSKPPEPAKKSLRADGPVEPTALVVTTDDDRQRTSFQILPLNPLRITFENATHTLRNPAPLYGSIDIPVVSSPLVFTSTGQPFPTAWCVVNSEFPSRRLRQLCTGSSSVWDKFIEANKAKYGPKDGGKAWQIDVCPLPSEVLPELALHGYGLAAS